MVSVGWCSRTLSEIIIKSAKHHPGFLIVLAGPVFERLRLVIIKQRITALRSFYLNNEDPPSSHSCWSLQVLRQSVDMEHTFACEQCGESYSRKSSLNRNVRTKHALATTQNLECQTCSKTFATNT